MKWRPTRVSQLTLALLAAMSLGALGAAELLPVKQVQRHVQEKLAASRKMESAIGVLAETRTAAGYEYDLSRDPHRTGLIGQEFTPITADRGTLEAKQIVAHPNFAALMVQLFKSAGVEAGDVVAIGWTGSLPGANLAVLAAADVLQLRPLIITSVCASMYGANDPSFTWLDMERVLVERGLFKVRSVAATYGADEDCGKGLGAEGRRLIREAAHRNGVPLLCEATFEKQVARRLSTYREHAGGRPIRLYVNVGGGMGSLGARINGHLLRPGLNTSIFGLSFGRDGVMTLLAREGVPVIHINYISRLCQRYGFPTDPLAYQPVGTGPMFYREVPNLYLVAGLLVGLLVVFFVCIRLDLGHYLSRRRIANDAL